ncbi:MAG TPA: hypothetical protein DDZ51_11935 [Planctomycetaceae bacterium]|nr:hypothetical protein [Planctomycetaceae bacterium]
MNKTLKTLCGVLVFMLAVVVIPSAIFADEPYKHAQKIAELVQPLLDSGAIQGVSIGVVDQEKHWIGNFGVLAKDRPTPPTDDTIYEIGSISKVFTGILLADAVLSGDVTLATNIGEILPEIAKSNADVASSIQLRHLSTHASGLPRMPTNIAPSDPLDPFADYDRRLMIDFMKTVKLGSKPGEPSEYSNFAVGLLGELLAIKADKSYAELLASKLAQPLAMKDTSTAVSDEARPRLAPPLLASGEPGREWRFDAMAGAGAIRSTPSDMLRFIDANLDPPAGRLGEAIELAWKQQSESKGDAFAMGLGWHIARDGSTRWHNGQTDGYHSMLLISRPLRAGVVVLSNSPTMEIDALGETIIRLIAGIKPQPIPMAGVEVDESVVKRLVGRYQLVPGFVLNVTANGKRLFVQATGQQQLTLVAQSETKWSIVGVEAVLEFELPKEGNAPAVTLHQNGASPKASRLAE